MRGIDAAALVEVVEHLDPSPLRRLGPALLGGLRPRLLVVTTPNLEYNALLCGLGSVLLPNRLRNSDHRFEWCAHLRDAWSPCGAAKTGCVWKNHKQTLAVKCS